jgi:DNA-binding response OmpR family regulator
VDYNVGGASGVDVLRAARASQPHARRVLMSGTPRERVLRDEGARALADAFFEKPMQADEWSRVLGTALA